MWGEMAPYFEDPRSATVEALTDAEVVELDATNFEKYLGNSTILATLR